MARDPALGNLEARKDCDLPLELRTDWLILSASPISRDQMPGTSPALPKPRQRRVGKWARGMSWEHGPTPGPMLGALESTVTRMHPPYTPALTA